MTLSVTIFNTSHVDRVNYTTSMNIVRSFFSEAFLHYTQVTNNISCVISQMRNQFHNEEKQHLNLPPFNFTRSSFSRYCYDATWALAWSLNKTMKGISI